MSGRVRRLHPQPPPLNAPTASTAKTATSGTGTSTYWNLIHRFKLELIRHTLFGYDGSRTRPARTLGLQRTYLLKLIRDYKISVPVRPRTHDNGSSP